MPPSNSRSQPILIAPAWPYASGPRHIGHVAGFAVPADVLARYYRLRGNPVLMASGTDEHGTPVMVAADDEGVSPREIADRYNQRIREDLRDLGISYDIFTRTTTRNHSRVVRDLFQKLYGDGYLFERETEGAFSASTGHTLPDRPDRAALADRRSASGLPEDEAPVLRPSGVRRPAARLDRLERPLAAERPQLLATVRRGGAAPCGDARSRLGRPDPRAGLRRPSRQEDLRLVRRGHRLPVRKRRVGGEPRRSGCMAKLVAEPR